MDFAFLTDEHLEPFNADPTPGQLGRYFTLEPPDLEFLHMAREPALRLGLAVQLCTAGYSDVVFGLFQLLSLGLTRL